MANQPFFAKSDSATLELTIVKSICEAQKVIDLELVHGSLAKVWLQKHLDAALQFQGLSLQT